MKQSIPAPVAIILGVLVLGGLGFFLYSHFLATPDSDDKKLEMKSSAMFKPGMTKEEAMKMYTGGGKK